MKTRKKERLRYLATVPTHSLASLQELQTLVDEVIRENEDLIVAIGMANMENRLNQKGRTRGERDEQAAAQGAKED